MALFYLSRRLFLNARRNIFCSVVRNNNDFKILSLDTDTIDDFTTQLIHKKVDKWTSKKVPNTYLEVKATEDFANKVIHLNLTKINVLFQDAIGRNDITTVLTLVNQCLRIGSCPNLSNLLYALSVCSQNGDIETIKKIQILCKETNDHILEAHSDFQHYIAEATWIKGNIPVALKLFKEVYKENALLRRRIRLMLKNLIVNIVENRSEAVLVNVITFAESLANQYNDYFPLVCIWQICFLSEWYSDQHIALNLFNKYEGLRKTVIHRITYVVAVSLHNHKIDIIYRLLEVLLKFEMKMQYSGVLLALLDYQIHQKDLRRCLEIIRWSVQNDIQLLPIQHQKFLNLFVTNEVDSTALKNLKPTKVRKTITHYKF